jgi:hypothetical protein
MEFYPDGHPRHGHRTPAELAEDEKLAALRGAFCGVYDPGETDVLPVIDRCLVPRERALLLWTDPANEKASMSAGTQASLSPAKMFDLAKSSRRLFGTPSRRH